MKRILSALLLFTLVACSDDSGPASESEPEPSANVMDSRIEAQDSRPQDTVQIDSNAASPSQATTIVAPLLTTAKVAEEAGSVASASDRFKAKPNALKRPTLEQADNTLPRGLLPAGVRPLSYALELTVVPEEERFSGHVDIAVELLQDTDRIYLHGNGLDVTAIEALLPSGKKVQATYTQVHADGIARLEFERPLQAGNVVLEFDYSADFGLLLHGLYKVEAQGSSYAFTQMASIYAREAFPSFDEPAFKTPFELTLNVREEHEALANTQAVEQTSLSSGMKRIRFAPSPPMTTYLFAIAVGPLDIVDGGAIPPNAVRKEPLPFRGVAIKGKGPELAYAMQETGAILESLETYFDRPYPYAKLDIIAVPDFEAGAMENIGAITFRERLLLLKDDASPQQKRDYASVMAHELAHMWFGNLVTMPWWNDIWLNESFATWMSYKAVAGYDPEQKPYIAQLKRTAYAMGEDGLISARQIREPVLDNDDIVAAFDGITYAKGGAVLSMFEHYIGEDVFRDGVRSHINKFAHSNATVHDFIESLSVAANQDLQPAADSFLFQNGVPLIEAELDCERGTVELTQSRYLPIGSKGDPEREWILPVCMKLGRGGEVFTQCTLLSGAETSVKLAGGCPDWLLPNADFGGYFHWLLPSSQYSTLLDASDQLNEKELLSVADSARAGFASARLDVAETWKVIEQLSVSMYPSVARSLLPTISFIEGNLGDNPKLRWTIRGRAASLYKDLKAYQAFDAEFLKSMPSNEMRIHYSDVASFMAEVAYDQPTRSAALAKARVYLGDEKEALSVSRSTLDTILTVGVQDGGQAFVDALYQRFLQSSDAWFRDTALSALARSRDPEFGAKLRDSALGDTLRSNEIRRLFSSHMEEDVNVQPTWEWLQSNMDELIEQMPARHAASLSQVARRLCDEGVSADIDRVFRVRLQQLPGGERRLNNALEQMQVCAASTKIQRPQAAAYFSQGGPRR